MNTTQPCMDCPRQCHVVRPLKSDGIGPDLPGYCHSPLQPVLARAALHFWEEPCISGTTGSGTVFFSGCTLRCVFCQNFQLSHENYGKTISASGSLISSWSFRKKAPQTSIS